jgi:hypothetical protein
MPSFVVLRHQMPEHAPRPSHWDVMFDLGDPALPTWALERPPDDEIEQIVTRLADHRLAYLDYEGPLTSGRGRVERWDRGICNVLSRTPDLWQLHLQGERLTGEVSLMRSAPDSPHWTYRYRAITQAVE